MRASTVKQFALDLVTLFSSTGTLLCCALPATLVALGAGGVMASLISSFPALVVVSVYKTELFLFSGVMLALGAFLQYRARSLPCPVDEKAAASCMRTRRISFVTYCVSLSIYVVGVFFAYLAPKFL